MPSLSAQYQFRHSTSPFKTGVLTFYSSLCQAVLPDNCDGLSIWRMSEQGSQEDQDLPSLIPKTINIYKDFELCSVNPEINK